MMQDIITNLSNSFTEYAPVIGGALVILILGWLIALFLSGVTKSILRKSNLNTKMQNWFGNESDETPPDIPSGAGRLVFWTVMLLAAIAVFQVFDLTVVSQPLSGFADKIIGFLPQLIGAGILLLLAWIIAKVVRLIVTKILQSTSLDEKVSTGSESGNGKSFLLSHIIGDVLYWLVYLLFLPAILETLSLEGILEPIQTMLNQFLGFLPNVFGALIIGFVGWFVANILQRIVTGLLLATGIDKLTEKYNLVPLSKIIGTVVFVFVLIPVLIAALNALKLDAITAPASSMLSLIFEALPNIFSACLILTIGYFLGKFVSGFVSRILEGLGINTIVSKAGLKDSMSNTSKPISELAGYVAFTIIILFSFFEASNMLGFATLTDIISEVTIFGGHLLFGIIVLFIGIYLSHIASTAIKKSAVKNAQFYSLIVRVVILVLVGSMAIRQMGIANDIINMAFGMTLGAMAIAAAVAFGIGGRELAAKKLAEWNESLK